MMEPPAAPLSTIYCTGFPPDFSEREFENMFKFAAGFMFSTLQVSPKGGLLGFARFDDPDHAATAIAFLHEQVVCVFSKGEN